MVGSGGERNLPGELDSGELEELREAATGDATARAAAGQLEQGVLGRGVGGGRARGCRPEVTVQAGD
jgi:hypothetical protein